MDFAVPTWALRVRGGTGRRGEGNVGEVGLDHLLVGLVQSLCQVVDPLGGKRGTELGGL